MSNRIHIGKRYTIYKTKTGSVSVEVHTPDLHAAMFEIAGELIATKQKLVNEIAKAADHEMEIEHLKSLGVCLCHAQFE
jgi:hypothetical protein